MFTLRPNQEEPIRKAIDFFNAKKPKPSLIVLPTAWGKSILTAYVAKNSTDKLIVLQPSKELLEQNYQKYCTLCGEELDFNAGIYSASFNKKEIAQITYATIGSITKLGAQFKEMGFTKMLIDEAHLYPREADSMLGRFLKDSGITHVLGITATPVKLQTNFNRMGEPFSKLVMLTSRSKHGNFFKEIIHVGQISEMVEMGYWSKLIYQADAKFDARKLRYNSTRSEFTAESVRDAFNANNGYSAIIRTLNQNMDRRHVLAFVPTIADAQLLAQAYPESAAIYGDMDKKERARIIAEFKEGKIRVIFNVRVLSTGFDYPGVDCIILGTSTASFASYYQIIGRATRIAPGKTDALIVDLAGNVKRFGRVEDITFEQGKLWRIFASGGKLISGIPIDQIGQFTHEDTDAVDNGTYEPPLMEVMPFGKYKGEPIKDVPLDYRRWMMRAFTWDSKNELLRKSIVATL